MSTSNEDAISQSSKKHKAKKRSHFPRNLLRRPFYSRKSRNLKTEEATDVGANVFPGTSSLSGDSHSLSMSSKGDALTIASGQSVAGAISVKSMSKLENISDPAMLECPLCLTTQLSDNFPKLMTCQHRSCMDCLRQYLTIEITESRVNLMCPECHERLHPVDMRNILKSSPQLIEKWEEFTLRRCLSVDPDCRWCPAPDCGYAVIAYGCASCPKLHCERPGCQTDFCYHCRQEWHPNQTCDAAHLQRRKELRVQSDSLTYNQSSNINDYIKPCPKCGALIAKMNDGSCNHMTCTVCETEFCWLCLQEITDLHYLSPSGCTFWGKKPWSRKKKILWQIGLLIGAPLGIGLVAGVAIPALIIGLPIWVARRVIAHFQKKANSSKHKRNTAVVASVFVSIVVSPILAALAVGVGVPVMLMYVYGVVPISLCRTGGYGITARTAANRARNAMRIDIGSPVIPTTNNTNMPEPVPHNGATHLITNPSIGEASVGGMTMASLSLSHGSMDHQDRDGDSASTTAIAGASITGSLSGSMAANAVLHNRKDVDQHSTHTQVSVASGTYTSVQVHMSDNISDNSVASHFQLSTGTAPKYASSKSIGAKRKTSKNKMSNSRKSTVPKKIHEHEENKAYGSSSQIDDVSQSKNDLTNNEIQKAVNEVLRSLVFPPHLDKFYTHGFSISGEAPPLPRQHGANSNAVLSMFDEKNEDAASTGSEASSCGSQHALLTEDKPTLTTVEICNEKKNNLTTR